MPNRLALELCDLHHQVGRHHDVGNPSNLVSERVRSAGCRSEKGQLGSITEKQREHSPTTQVLPTELVITSLTSSATRGRPRCTTARLNREVRAAGNSSDLSFSSMSSVEETDEVKVGVVRPLDCSSERVT